MNAKEVVGSIKAARKRMGLSQRELANLAGIHPMGLGLIERGQVSPKLDTVCKLMAALKSESEKTAAVCRSLQADPSILSLTATATKRSA